MRIEFATAAQIVFGRGVLQEIGPAARGLGEKALVVTGYRGPDFDKLCQLLEANGISWSHFSVSSEPSIETVEAGIQAARSAGCDLIIGFGGGSAIDTAKAVAALITNPGEVLDYLEVVGRGQSLRERPAPFIAIPTTAGTGSEVTRNAVLAVPEKRVKVSLRSPMMLARLALVDPDLTLGLPPAVTATTGMDALAQVIEPYVSNRANPLTDLYCREGILRGSRSLLRAYQNGQDSEAREDMAFTSLMGGLALANAGLGAVHGFAGPIGGMFDAPHGAICACLLPPVVLVNSQALAEREPANPALARYAEIARWVTGRQDATASDLGRWLIELRESLQIPSLGELGIRPGDVDLLVQMSAVASSMKANPLKLTRSEMREILELGLS